MVIDGLNPFAARLLRFVIGHECSFFHGKITFSLRAPG